MVLNDFEQQWFSSNLAAAGQQPLIRQTDGQETNATLLRFIWLPSFDHSIIVEIKAKSGGERRLEAIRLAGAGGYEPGAVADKIDRPLTEGEWQRVEGVIADRKLFEQPSGECQLGLDGSEWIVEAVDNDGYHFLKRWTPQSGPMREFGLLLLNLTGWKFKEIY